MGKKDCELSSIVYLCYEQEEFETRKLQPPISSVPTKENFKSTLRQRQQGYITQNP